MGGALRVRVAPGAFEDPERPERSAPGLRQAPPECRLRAPIANRSGGPVFLHSLTSTSAESKIVHGLASRSTTVQMGVRP